MEAEQIREGSGDEGGGSDGEGGGSDGEGGVSDDEGGGSDGEGGGSDGGEVDGGCASCMNRVGGCVFHNLTQFLCDELNKVLMEII